MLRLIGRIFLTLLVCNWVYAEVMLYAPEAKPKVDHVLSKIKIPTHDTWSAYYKAFSKKRDELVVRSIEVEKSIRTAL